MIKKWRYFPLQTKSPSLNMAIDEALFRAKINNPDLPNSFRLYRWNPSAASCGKHQNINQEIEINEAKSRQIRVVRRITGGGAVFHDKIGEMTYSVVVSSDDFIENSPDSLVLLLLKGLQEGFRNLGLDTTYDKIHCPSLFVKGKKISGNAQLKHSNVLLQQGTILVDYSPELMYSVLKARPDKPRLKMIESVYAYVTTLKKELGNEESDYEISYEEISNQIQKGFQNTFTNFDWVKSFFTDEELAMMRFLEKNKYSNEDWTIRKKEVIFQMNLN